MTTANDVIRSALRRLGILGIGQTLSAQHVSEGLDSLNQMLASWRTQGVDLGITILSQTDTVPVDEAHDRAIIALLAIDIAPTYGKSVPAELAVTARDGWKALVASCFNDDADNLDMKVPSGLLGMPGQKSRSTLI